MPRAGETIPSLGESSAEELTESLSKVSFCVGCKPGCSSSSSFSVEIAPSPSSESITKEPSAIGGEFIVSSSLTNVMTSSSAGPLFVVRTLWRNASCLGVLNTPSLSSKALRLIDCSIVGAPNMPSLSSNASWLICGLLTMVLFMSFFRINNAPCIVELPSGSRSAVTVIASGISALFRFACLLFFTKNATVIMKKAKAAKIATPTPSGFSDFLTGPFVASVELETKSSCEYSQ
mmetsp:Transcript_19980/g.28429  ORF Transcript_19980/g.28429 Transcript_19980/m.28429 type:complete len:234 (+) Transcript_19980:225-926(+)